MVLVFSEKEFDLKENSSLLEKTTFQNGTDVQEFEQAVTKIVSLVKNGSKISRRIKSL